MYTELKKDATTLQADDVTLQWLEDFDKFLKKSSPSADARGIHFRNLKAVLNYAVKHDLIDRHPFNKFDIPKNKVQKKQNLDIEALRRIIFAQGLPEHLEKYRDFFTLSFMLTAEMNADDIDSAVAAAAAALNLDNVEVVHDGSGLSGRQASAKGFYNRRTGKITIVASNNETVADAMATLLHEAVAHYGLRALFGERFYTFIDNVYSAATPEVRRRIDALAADNGWNVRTATEEYMATLAEDTNFEQAQRTGWWAKIRQVFADMLALGVPGFDGAAISDNELRYILWRSYRNLTERAGDSLIAAARDAARRAELGLTSAEQYQPVLPQTTSVARANEEDDVLLRSGRKYADAREEYDDAVRTITERNKRTDEVRSQGIRILVVVEPWRRRYTPGRVGLATERPVRS